MAFGSDKPFKAYEGLRDELSKTGVISLEFKRLLLSYSGAIAQEAYDRGKQDGKVIGYAEALKDADDTEAISEGRV